MLHVRNTIWCAGLAAALTLAGPARAEHAFMPDKGEQRAATPLEHWLFLLPPGTTTCLDLNEQQTDQVIKLEYEYRAKRRTLLLQFATHIAAAFHDDTPAAPAKDGAAAPAKVDGAQLGLAVCTDLLKMRELRDVYECKVLEVLNAEQKKQFVALQRLPFAERHDRREARRDARIEHRSGYTPSENQSFADPHKVKLNLTDEQKAKVAELQREMKEKFLNILTEEQKKQIESFQQQRQPGATEKPAAPDKSEK